MQSVNVRKGTRIDQEAVAWPNSEVGDKQDACGQLPS
jgi:hypothetical protein